MHKSTLRLLATASCLTLVIGLQAFAETQLEQPNSIALDTAPIVKRDQQVSPVGYTDSCCGDETASGRAVCCPKRVMKMKIVTSWANG